MRGPGVDKPSAWRVGRSSGNFSRLGRCRPFPRNRARSQFAGVGSGIALHDVVHPLYQRCRDGCDYQLQPRKLVKNILGHADSDFRSSHR